ncbi:hypothetical protein C1H46_039367 [Malus baccata]|nr:hypothetical protein C1H46_039367 [Malus baccata]
MEKELHRAAVRGSVDALLELLSEDPQILNRTVPSLSDMPLHVASLLGHSAFAEELLSRNPELAAELDSRGSSPLHLAAAKGSVEIVKNLVRVNPDLGFVLDRDGFTPLHLGVIKGRAAVVAELAQVRPAATRVLTQGGESGLHLCVKHHRLEVLKVLVESIGRDDEFVNWRDGDGNTVLHVAVAKKQLEVIKYLLTNTKIDVNAQNAIGFTALDVLTHSTRDLRDLEIKQSLQKAAAPRTNRARSIAFEPEMDSVRVSNSISMQPLMSKKMSMVIMWIAITALSGTYFVGLIFMTPDRNRGSYLYYVTQISVLIWLGLMGLVFIGNLIRVIIWLLRMYGYMEEKETDDSLYVDYDDNDEI